MDRVVPSDFRRSNLLAGLAMLVIVASGPAVAVLLNFQHELRRDRSEQARSVATQQAELLNAAVGGVVEGARQMMAGFAASLPADGSCAGALHDLRLSAPSYDLLAVLRPDGTAVCTDSVAPISESALAGLAQPLMSVTAFTTGRYAAVPGMPSPMLMFARKLTGPAAAHAAVMIAGFDLGRLGSLVAGLHRLGDGHFIVADRGGLVLAEVPFVPGAVGAPLEPSQLAALHEPSSGAILTQNSEGVLRAIGYVPPTDDPASLFVCAGSSVAALISGLNDAADRGYLLILAGAALSLLFALFIGHRTLRVPCAVLLGAARRWGSGDLSARAEMPRAATTEFAGLGQAFNEMAEVLQQQRSELQALNDALEVRVAGRTRALLDSNNRLQVEIAERELTEGSLRQAQKLQAVGQLAGGIARDFNDLLAAILGSLELLRKRLGPSDARQERLLAIGTTAVERGSRLTTQLLAFSRKQPLLAVSVSVVDSITGMAGLLHGTLGSSVRLETRLDGDLWPVMLDPNQFEASILNLALNARDAMPSGGRLIIGATNQTITPASAWSELAMGDYVCVTVADTGLGMSPDILNRAFEPFFTTKEPANRAGLGLSQVHGMVRQSGGSITIESRIGDGTRVRMMLPRSLTAPIETVEGPDHTQPAIERGQAVLLVDDDERVRAVTEMILADNAYTVLTAVDAASALEVLEREGDRIAIVIADHAMPGITGRDLLQIVKQRRPGIAVVLATGYADYPELTADDLPIDHILYKPFRSNDLLAKLHMVVRRQSDVGGREP